MSSSTLTFDYPSFIVVAPAYSNIAEYSMATLQAFWNAAINYISNVGNYGCLQDGARQYAINLMTAHLVYIANLVAAGTVPYLMQESTIDKVHVGLKPPETPNEFRWWLNTSPYGMALITLLEMNSVGGFYIGGSAPRAAFGYQGGGFFPGMFGGC